MKARTRGLLFLTAKVVLAAALITWLIRSGALDFRALAVMLRQPWLIALDLAIFAFAAWLTAVRWRMLLSLTGVEVPLGRAVQLQFVAVFFNVVIPGNIGGDVVKALYAARDAGPEKRTNILLVAFVERLVGLGALVLVASVITLVSPPSLLASPQLQKLRFVVMLLGAATLLGPIAVGLIVHRAGDRLEMWTSGPSAISRIAKQLVAALRLLASGPRKLVVVTLLSMAMHLMSIFFFAVLTPVTTGQDVPFSSIATVYPLGILTIILPISPAGLGVGHVAFNRLFEAIGLHGGATVFNVFLIGQIAPCLLGVFPYLALKRTGELPTPASESADAQ